MQIIGGALIVAATTMLGIHMGQAGSRRTRDLMEFKKSLILLKSQIDYSIYTLPQAFSHIAERTAPPFNEFYAKLAENPSSWEQGVSELKSSNLSKDDIANIALLGMSLGQMDAGVQINSIDMVIAGIDDSLAQLMQDNPKNTKMYRGLGVVSGLLITIVLL